MNLNKSRSGLFLMELIMAIFIFSIASTICIQMFIKSHVLSQKSVELNHAVTWCGSMAELFYATDGNLEKMAEELDYSYFDDSMNNISIYYDDSFLSVDGINNATYCVTGSVSESDQLITLNIQCKDLLDNEDIYSLKPTLFPQKNN